MKKLKILSGKEIVKIFENFGFEVAKQKGSHLKLGRITKDKTKQTLTIPLHSELDKGTIKAIYRQAFKYIPEEELKPYFYHPNSYALNLKISFDLVLYQHNFSFKSF